MKVVSYDEMIKQPSGTVCAAYYDNMLGDIFVIDIGVTLNSKRIGFACVKYLTPTIRDGSLSWEYIDNSDFDIADMYGNGDYAILDKNDINTIIEELRTW